MDTLTTTSPMTDSAGTILVIEHDQLLREGVHAILGPERYHVLEASDATVGCTVARESHPDLIICAVNMPDRNGYETLGQLRRDVQTADISVILVSDKWVNQSEVRFAMSLGANDYFVRPYKATDLLGSVHSRLEYRRAAAIYEEARISRLREGTV